MRDLFQQSINPAEVSVAEQSECSADRLCVCFSFSCRENKMLSCKCLNFIASQQQQQQSGAPPAFSLHAFRQAFLQKYPRNFIFYSQCMDFFKQVHSIYLFFVFEVQRISLYVCVLMHFIWVSGWYIYPFTYFISIVFYSYVLSLAQLQFSGITTTTRTLPRLQIYIFFWRRGLLFEISALKCLGHRLRKFLIPYYFSLFKGENFELF